MQNLINDLYAVVACQHLFHTICTKKCQRILFSCDIGIYWHYWINATFKYYLYEIVFHI